MDKVGQDYNKVQKAFDAGLELLALMAMDKSVDVESWDALAMQCQALEKLAKKQVTYLFREKRVMDMRAGAKPRPILAPHWSREDWTKW